MNRNGRRRSLKFHPRTERVEGRLLLSRAPLPASLEFLKTPAGVHVVRPNTPVAPFGADVKVASFIDPSVKILNGNHVLIGQNTYVAPYATLNSSRGYIKIGSNSGIEDNATILSDPSRAVPATNVVIGDSVLINFGATVQGPSTIGAYGKAAKPTSIGANALIDGATIEPGAMVSALARVGPGVTVPTGFRVLPGANVTTNAEASNPALGMVAAVTASDTARLTQILSNNKALAAGYTTLYQGNAATGVNPGVPASVTGIFNGSLAVVEGTSQEPGPPTVPFEPKRVGPQFPSPHQGELEGLIPTFRARVTGQVVFQERAALVAHHLGRSNSFRADQGQPINIGSIGQTGTAVTINAPLGTVPMTTGTGSGTTVVNPGGGLNIGQNFRADSNAVLLGGAASGVKGIPPAFTLGDNVSIGSGAVVDRSSIGSNSTIGPRAYVATSTLAAGSNIPAGAIVINGQLKGFIQW